MARFRNNQQHTLVERIHAEGGLCVERVQRFDELALLPEVAFWRTWSFRITLSGTRHLQYQQQTYTLAPNTILLNGPLQEPVRIRGLPGVGSDIVVLSVATDRWSQFAAQHPTFACHNADLLAVSPEPPRVARHSAPPHILRVVRQILALAPQGHTSRLAMENHCVLLLRLLGELRFGACTTGQEHERRRVEAAQRHMVERLDRPPSLEEIAAALSISQRQLQRDFLICSGMTPMRYLNTMRLSEANFLLAETALPVGAIAAQLGYPSPAAFSAAFRQHYGCSPRQVRGELAAMPSYE
jgi:AraC-like DNA-binding protein